MPNRLLTALNILLALICIACLYYLVTARYEEPAEIKKARDWKPRAESEIATPIPGPETTNRPAPGVLAKPIMAELYTPTPTPTPAPTPPPPPPNLEQAVAKWVISGITDEKTVEFTDSGSQETFTLIIGDAGRDSPDAQGRPVKVQLLEVNMDDLKATLGSAEGQKVVKSF